MNKKIGIYLKSSLQAFVFVFFLAILQQAIAAEPGSDPLPSWNEGTVKSSIIEFVGKATDKDSSGYIPVEERIATLDNDGTLWPEQPAVELVWIVSRAEEMLKEKPELAQADGPFKLVKENGVKALDKMDGKNEAELMLRAESRISVEDFQQRAEAFINSSSHPKLGMPYTKIAYAPMLELMDYLRANGFKVYICTGGSSAFVRTFSQELYGVAPEQVIGSSLKKIPVDENDKMTLWNESPFFLLNDKANKPIGIDFSIGKRPVFAAGNVGGAGDIDMLRYSQGSKNSLQIIVNHDDDVREFSYTEAGNASLDAAKQYGWQVISMKNDWKEIFKKD